MNVGFVESELTIMNENAGQNSLNYPTRINMLNALNNLVNFANANKNSFIVFYYSGHGTQIQQTSSYVNINAQTLNTTGTIDEAIIPVDFQTNGVIVDEELRTIFIQKLSSSTTLFAIIDACNSGTALDLKFGYIMSGVDYTNAIRTITDVQDNSTCTAISISACRDNQTAAAIQVNPTDTYIQSILTWSFLNSYKTASSIGKLLQTIQTNITNKFGSSITQVTQIATNKIIDLEKTILPNNIVIDQINSKTIELSQSIIIC